MQQMKKAIVSTLKSMWNKYRLFLWIHVKVRENPKTNSKKVNIHLPVPLYALGEIMDCVDDLAQFLGLFVKSLQVPVRKGHLEVHVFQLLSEALALFDSLRYGEPLDLVDVETKDATVKISLK